MLTSSPIRKMIFAGTPQLAAGVLSALCAVKHIPLLVLTQIDKPAGRGMQLTASPVKILAQQHQIPILQPISLKNNPTLWQQLEQLQPDLMIVVAFGMIIPQQLLDIPRYGCINIHFSLLPRWRGAAPIQRAIMAGDTTTGVSIIQMDAGLDTGDILAIERCKIAATDTAGSLANKLVLLGNKLLIQVLDQFDKLNSVPQTQDGSCYAHKITKVEALLDWNRTATELVQQINGLNPSPRAFCYLLDKICKILQATAAIPTAKYNPIGAIGCFTVQNSSILVQCGTDSILEINQLQLAGEQLLSSIEFIKRHHRILCI